MTKQHTPGPWKVHGANIYAPDGAIIATVRNPGSKASDYPLERNRDLMASAPDLLNLAEQLLPFLEVMVAKQFLDDREGKVEACRAIIAKAKVVQP